jgi:hypothetical protein
VSYTSSLSLLPLLLLLLLALLRRLYLAVVLSSVTVYTFVAAAVAGGLACACLLYSSAV